MDSKYSRADRMLKDSKSLETVETQHPPLIQGYNTCRYWIRFIYNYSLYLKNIGSCEYHWNVEFILYKRFKYNSLKVVVSDYKTARLRLGCYLVYKCAFNMLRCHIEILNLCTKSIFRAYT